MKTGRDTRSRGLNGRAWSESRAKVQTTIPNLGPSLVATHPHHTAFPSELADSFIAPSLCLTGLKWFHIMGRVALVS